MKKRMFLSTILMTLVLLLAVTTATFAWYTSNSAQGVSSSSTTASLSTTGTKGELGSLSFDFTFKGTGEAGAIKSVELTDADGIVQVVNKQGVVVPATNQDALDKAEEVTITLTGVSYADVAVDAENWGTYKGTYTVTLQATGKVKLAATEAEAVKAKLEVSDVTFTVKIDETGNVTYVGNVVHFAMDGTGSGVDEHQAGTIKVKSVVLN